MYAARRKIHFTSVSKNAVSTMCAIKSVPAEKNRRIITTHSVWCDTAVSGIIFFSNGQHRISDWRGREGRVLSGKAAAYQLLSAACVWNLLFSIHCFNGSACGFVPLWGAWRRMHPPLRLFQAGLPVDLFSLRYFAGGYILRFSLSGVYSRVFIPLWAVWRWMPQSARRSESRRSSRRRCISGRRPGQSSRCRSGRRQ